jgi:nitroimidazol reductase NimA-like FMN-containing flavoprotein (pyridoxamine 5'-phosphate oxidase superfamily)
MAPPRAASRGPGPGDLGRRVADRRRQLGLTPQQLAAGGGMAVGYVEALEARPAHLTTEALVRLASALHTTPGELLGGDVDRAPGRGRPATRSSLEAMGDDEATRLLATGGIGRVVFAAERGPVALPVNYQLLDDAIVFRTAAGTSLDAAAGQDPVSFEVDHIDEAASQGWSVLATGRLQRVEDHGLRRRLLTRCAKSWAGPDRRVLLRVTIRAISGRRIRARW